MVKCWIHEWGKWEDVNVTDIDVTPLVSPIITRVHRQVILQQRRCSRCNKAKTSHS